MLFLLAAALTVGDVLPKLEGDYLTGAKASLPGAARGKVTLLALGFSYESRFAVEPWVKQFRVEFGQRPDVAFYEVPMIGGMARMAKFFIDSGMRRGTPKQDHERVITVYGGASEWKQRLKVTDSDSAYVLLLDRNGKVLWQHSGKLDPLPWADLKAATAAALDPAH